MTRIRLAYVQGFLDRHGRPRYYFRRPGFERVALPGLPGSDEFMAAYQAALSGETAPRRQIGAGTTKPGTVAALTVAYFNGAEFKNLAATTRSTYRGIVQRFRDQHGDKRVALLSRAHIVGMLNAKAGTPTAANNWLDRVRALMRLAIELGLRADDPTLGIKGVKVRSTGFYTWSEEDIAKYEAAHAIGTRARLALGLLLYSAQRRGDVVRMGRQHIRNGVLTIRQQKTGAVVDIPIHTDLKATLDATPSDHLTFLTTKQGQPFTAAGFGNWFAECCRAAGLPKECSAHGLRKAAARRLAEHGCTSHEIMAITGHKTLKEVERYTQAADRKRLAESAIARTSVVKPGKAV